MNRGARYVAPASKAAETVAPGVTTSGVLRLHRAAGNAAVAQLLRRAAGLPGGFAAIARAEAHSATEFYAKYEYPSLGFTTKVEGHDGPDVDYGTYEHENDDEREEEDENEEGWFANPKLTSASEEGTNESWTVAAGSWAVEEEDGTPIVLDVSGDVAAKVLAAEDEHNGDYRYANELVLRRADDWITEQMPVEYGPAKSEDEAIALVDADLNRALPGVLGLTAVANFHWVNLGSYYARLCNQTEKRDTNGWHTFGFEERDQDDRVVVTVTTGATKIGQHPSDQVILPGTVT